MEFSRQMLKVSTAAGAAATLGPAAGDAAAGAAWAAIAGEAASSNPAARAVPVSHLLTVRNFCLPSCQAHGGSCKPLAPARFSPSTALAGLFSFCTALSPVSLRPAAMVVHPGKGAGHRYQETRPAEVSSIPAVAARRSTAARQGGRHVSGRAAQRARADLIGNAG
jgi:hypothetical protein